MRLFYHRCKSHMKCSCPGSGTIHMVRWEWGWPKGRYIRRLKHRANVAQLDQRTIKLPLVVGTRYSFYAEGDGYDINDVWERMR